MRLPSSSEIAPGPPLSRLFEGDVSRGDEPDEPVDFLKRLGCFTGTAQSVADEMQEWFESEACDGFVLAATHMPGAYEDFVRLVVPELQRRGVFRREFAGTTLRENLGLPRAAPFDWQRTPAA